MRSRALPLFIVFCSKSPSRPVSSAPGLDNSYKLFRFDFEGRVPVGCGAASIPGVAPSFFASKPLPPSWLFSPPARFFEPIKSEPLRERARPPFFEVLRLASVPLAESEPGSASSAASWPPAGASVTDSLILPR